MSGSYMFGEFISIIKSIFSYLTISKYSWLLIAVIVSAASWVLSYIIRWLSNA